MLLTEAAGRGKNNPNHVGQERVRCDVWGEIVRRVCTLGVVFLSLLVSHTIPHTIMIQFLLVQNRQGKTRVSKWYAAYDDAEKRKLAEEIHRVVNSREAKFTNFVEVCTSSVLMSL